MNLKKIKDSKMEFPTEFAADFTESQKENIISKYRGIQECAKSVGAKVEPLVDVVDGILVGGGIGYCHVTCSKSVSYGEWVAMSNALTELGYEVEILEEPNESEDIEGECAVTIEVTDLK